MAVSATPEPAPAFSTLVAADSRAGDWACLTADAALARLGSSPHGLSEDESADRLRRFGPNTLPRPKRPSTLWRLLRQFHNVFIYVLLAAAAVTAGLGHWGDTAVILAVVFVNAIVGFLQEGKAERAIEAVQKMLSPVAIVIRGGHRRVLPADDLVLGDVVVIQSGDRVAADLRLMSAQNLATQEAALTGESLPVEKSTAPVASDASLPDLRSMAFAGTLVARGQGLGLVVAVATHTELGRISQMLARIEPLTTPLLRQLDVFGRRLSAAILILALAVFVVGWLVHGMALADVFVAAVALAVAAIPEGLPAIITIVLALGVQRMAARNAIIRHLPAVETLGSVGVIFTDKTGTLTRNELTARHVVTAHNTYQASGGGYDPAGEFSICDPILDHGAASEPPGDLVAVLQVAVECSDATLEHSDGSWRITGDPTEAAMIVAARKAGLDEAVLQSRATRTDVIPFESEHRYMAVLSHDHLGHGFIYVKGAPERVLDMCAFESFDGSPRSIDREFWERQVDELARKGERVLAIAMRPVAPERRVLAYSDFDQCLVLVGLIGQIDAPRIEAIRAVASCQSAGIEVKMVTGDHPLTAQAIARDVGFKRPAPAITGAMLDAMDEAELARSLQLTDVFARVSPEHKLKLLSVLQSQGKIVAMTGDGVNDAPALKRADIGISMGREGTEAAREASAMVLSDDNFSSIAAAVEEGRTVYNNLKKTIIYLLPTNGGEAAAIVVGLAFAITLPISPIQILWVNLATGITLTLAFAFEPAESDVMRRSPRPPNEPILSGQLIWRIGFVSVLMLAAVLGLFLFEIGQGASVAAARTAAVNGIVACEIAYLFNTRFLLASSFTWRVFLGNWVALAAVVAVVVGQMLFTYWAPLQAAFGTADISMAAWGRAAVAGVALFLLVEAEKALMRRRHR